MEYKEIFLPAGTWCYWQFISQALHSWAGINEPSKNKRQDNPRRTPREKRQSEGKGAVKHRVEESTLGSSESVRAGEMADTAGDTSPMSSQLQGRRNFGRHVRAGPAPRSRARRALSTGHLSTAPPWSVHSAGHWVQAAGKEIKVDSCRTEAQGEQHSFSTQDWLHLGGRKGQGLSWFPKQGQQPCHFTSWTASRYSLVTAEKEPSCQRRVTATQVLSSWVLQFYELDCLFS